MERHIWLPLVFSLSLLLVFEANALTSSYWDSVNAIVNGDDFYDILQVTSSADAAEIKKSFRKVSMKYHPDRNPSEEAKTQYLKVTLAYSILTDPDARVEYDHLLKHGIPTQDRYYGRYAHKVGIPPHNPWIVFGSLFGVATVVHFLMARSHYRYVMRMIKKSPDYQKKRQQNMLAAGIDLKKQKKAEKAIPNFEPADDDPYAPPIYIHDSYDPGVWDLLPILIVRRTYEFVKNFNAPELPPVEKLRRHMELRDQCSYTTADAEKEMAQFEARQQEFLNSNKYRRYLKWQRQHGH